MENNLKLDMGFERLYGYGRDSYGIRVAIGKKESTHVHVYMDSTDRFSFSVPGSNEAYDYLLNKFWRYLGAA
ncbi:MAG: hypothetical protein V3T88_07885 [Nitrosomonadaceae bacterium]